MQVGSPGHPVEGEDKIFSIECPLYGGKNLTSGAAEVEVLTSDSVDAGKMWVITAIYVWDIDNNPTWVDCRINHDGSDYEGGRDGAPGADLFINLLAGGAVYLDADDYIEGRVKGSQNNDGLKLIYFGYQLNAP